MINLKFKFISLPPSGWYNLDTNRVNSQRDIAKYGLMYPNVCSSSWETIAFFLYLNNIDHINIRFVVDSDKTLLCNAFHRNLSFSPNNSNDLNLFQFKNIFTMAKVIDVIDGDTIDILLTLTPSSFRFCVSQSPVISWSNDFEITLKLRLRLYGIDAMESNTLGGQKAKEYAKILYSQWNNQIYVYLMGYDAHNRTLALVYSDQSRNVLINKLILDHIDPECGKICKEYYC
jgi:endonuclease YncB( thermonuclease family)